MLHWRSCYGGFQCATARVPLSYRDPRGAAISIAVVRHLATDPARRAGTLFYNGGLPPEQIGDFVTGFGQLPAGFTARYDIITFDPRGSGYSTAVRCFPTMAAESKFLGGAVFGGLPVFPVGARQEAAWVQTWARFDARCAQRNGSLLDHDTTADVARDMNLLREAVGAPVLNYIGRVLRHRARRHLRQPVPRHDRAHGPGREPQPGRMDPPGRRADLSRPGNGPGGRGGDAGLPRPVRQGGHLGLRVLRRDPGRDPR